MSNWILLPTGSLANLDYMTQIYAKEHEGKWYVIGEIAGKEAAFLLTSAFESEQEAKAYVQNMRLV